MALTATIAASASGANQVVAGAAGYKFRVIAFLLSFSGTVNAKWQSGSTDKTGLVYGTAAALARSPDLPSLPSGIPIGQFVTDPGDDLNLNLSGNVAVGGWVRYEKIGASQ
jgi:hypothetical protein